MFHPLSLSLQQGRAAAGPAAAGDGRRGRGRQGGQGEGKPLMDELREGGREVRNVKLSEIGSCMGLKCILNGLVKGLLHLALASITSLPSLQVPR